MRRLTNSAGNTAKDVRKFLRKHGVAPNVAMVERIQREVSRTQSQNERVVAIHKELGGPATVDSRGRDAQAAALAATRRRLDAGQGPRRPI